MLREHAVEIRNALTDPIALCSRLGLSEGAQRQGGGLLIRCPAHDERDPSCSVTRGPDGTVRARCFACDWTGDALDLVAEVCGLSTRHAFAEVLSEAANVAGMLGLAADLRDGAEPREYQRRPPPPPVPPVEYPDEAEVKALWDSSVGVSSNTAAASMLMRRGIDPSVVRELNLLRAINTGIRLPPWAAYRGRSWVDTGHLVLVRVWDANGLCRSLRAWNVTSGDGAPKRLPPARKRSSGLILANRMAVAMLMGRESPGGLIVVEGEPDWVVWSTRQPLLPVIGVGSGWWTQEHADRVPDGTSVWLRTHTDEAGDRYAEQIAKTLGDRCQLWRKRAA